MKNVMKKAWEIAKNAATKFGGKAVDYITQALKQAWAEAKKVVKRAKESFATLLNIKTEERVMHYSEYKNNYASNKIVKGSYNATTKTITVIVETFVAEATLNIKEMFDKIADKIIFEKDAWWATNFEDVNVDGYSRVIKIDSVLIGFENRRYQSRFFDLVEEKGRGQKC